MKSLIKIYNRYYYNKPDSEIPKYPKNDLAKLSVLVNMIKDDENDIRNIINILKEIKTFPLELRDFALKGITKWAFEEDEIELSPVEQHVQDLYIFEPDNSVSLFNDIYDIFKDSDILITE